MNFMNDLYVPRWLSDKRINPNTVEFWNHVHKMILMFEYGWMFSSEKYFNVYFNYVLKNNKNKVNRILRDVCFSYNISKSQMNRDIKAIVNNDLEEWYPDWLGDVSKIKEIIINSNLIKTPYKMVLACNIELLSIDEAVAHDIVTFFDKIPQHMEYGVDFTKYVLTWEVTQHVDLYFKKEEDLILAKLLLT